MTALYSSLAVVDTAEQLAAWAPGPLLAAALLFMASSFIAVGVYAVKSLGRRLDAIEATQAVMSAQITALANAQHVFATRESLGSVAERFDTRVADLRERMRVAETQLERIDVALADGRKNMHDLRNSAHAIVLQFEVLRKKVEES